MVGIVKRIAKNLKFLLYKIELNRLKVSNFIN